MFLKRWRRSIRAVPIESGGSKSGTLKFGWLGSAIKANGSWALPKKPPAWPLGKFPPPRPMVSGRTTWEGKSVRLPSRNPATLPAWGVLTPPWNCRPVCMICQPASCTAAPRWKQDRTSENLSAICACFGRISERSIPGALVEMGLNGPRTSRGASGLTSNVSIWLGAPRLKIMIAERLDLVGSTPLESAAARYCGRPKPIAPSVPTWRKSLRRAPLQV